MQPFITARRAEIAELCRRYGVVRLDVFGSATSPRFDPHKSDVDFIVRFADEAAPGVARRFIALAGDLEHLLGRRVDLITDQPFRNPYFAAAVAASRETVFEHLDCTDRLTG